MTNLEKNYKTKLKFIKTLSSSITWPLACIGSFIDNIVEAWEISKTLEKEKERSKQNLFANGFNNLVIDIGLHNCKKPRAPM